MKHIEIGKGGAVFAVLLTLIAGIAFWGCPMENDGYVPFDERDRRFEYLGLQAETLRRISHDFNIRLSWECYFCPACHNPFLHYYFGTYNGYVVMGQVGARISNTSVTVARFEFSFDLAPVIIFVWNNNGRIYDVRDALELGFLMLDDIETMYERHNRNETGWRRIND